MSEKLKKTTIEECFRSKEEEDLWRLYRAETPDEEIIRRIKRDGLEWQIKYRGCAQAALYVLVMHLRPGGVSDPWQVVPGMTSLCAGVASKRTGPCGALIGGIYALGMEFGREDFYEPGGPKEGGPAVLTSNFFRCNGLAAELYDKFSKMVGSAMCGEILEKEFGKGIADPTNPELMKMFSEGTVFDLLSTEASRQVSKAAVLTAEIILRERKKLPNLNKN